MPTKTKKPVGNTYERKETYKPEEILNFLPNPSDYPKYFKLKTIKKDYDGDLMKMGSDRYYVFKQSLSCDICHIKGSFMAKERSLNKHGVPTSESYHFNLYAINEAGEEVLMTKDHIIPKSKGGKDELSNYITFCTLCNYEKQNMDDDLYRELKSHG